jgi:glycosyltransferase involved in cell wall biosynthesis
MRIAIVTDAWAPQVNGVVRTLRATVDELRGRGHEIDVTSPDLYRSLPCPTYPEIRLALAGQNSVGRKLERFAPHAIHISTEGPLGWAARGWCLSRGRRFTTAYHTQFPDYLARRTGLTAELFWPAVRRFHQAAGGILVATETIRRQLRARGLEHVRPWSRGVDLTDFRPGIVPPDLFFTLPRPIQLYVGRVAVEKNVQAFLSNDHPGSKVVAGDGPALARLQAQFPETVFLGRQQGEALAACYAGADVLVFPSRTDTFGLVMIEALACGTPVAAYPVPGPVDVLTSQCGATEERLEDAIAAALALDRNACLEHGRSFSWQASADQFLAALEADIASGERVPVVARAA